MRRSRASGASESSIDWFWQTMQRNCFDSTRARASCAGSFRISSGCTATAVRSRNEQQQDSDEPQPAHEPYSAGCIAGLALAGFGAPTRSRRSVSDSVPPITITMVPSQISSTSGL